MGRKALFRQAHRVNILIEKTLHEDAQKRATEFGIRGGFSEYVSRLIKADKARKGRAVMQQGRA
jgi:hypothetical protein